MPIIRSLVDNDLYKLTMQWFALALYPHARAKVRFINRRKERKFTPAFLEALQEEIFNMTALSLTPQERIHLENRCPFLPPQYLDYLQNYRFDPKELTFGLRDGELELEGSGYWHKIILWEVPLMATISELYFQMMEQDWIESERDQLERARTKQSRLHDADCKNADYGTRRRRSWRAQELFVSEAVKSPHFVGTSNVLLSMMYNCLPLGTIAHEAVQAVSVLEGLRHANRFTLDAWASVYKASLGTALPDTFGLQAFLNDFTVYHAKLWDGVRWDSGCPFAFTDTFVDVYRKYRIDPLSKYIVYSNNLNVSRSIKIRQYCENKINRVFGIGTHFSNDFRKRSESGEISLPLNMVIKMVEMEGVPTVKLSEDPEKTSGDPNAIKDALWTFLGTPIC